MNIVQALVCGAIAAVITYGMFWMYFRLVPRVATWVQRKLGL